MGETSAISWTDATFNPWWGCSKVSAECTNCYAESTAERFAPNLWGVNGARRMFGDAHWNEPIKWNRRALAGGRRLRVFCASMADVFEDRPELVAPRARLFALIKQTTHLDWLLLTKRPENMASMLPWLTEAWPNVWLGVTAGTRESLKRVEILRDVPAAVRFISCEPILEHITSNDWDDALAHDGFVFDGEHISGVKPRIHWLIVGDESGAKRRPARADWVRTAREAAMRNRVAFHFKQWNGGASPSIARPQGSKGGKIHLPILDGKQWAQFPEVKS
jgi:protein gp37